jgi:hypothetical protein
MACEGPLPQSFELSILALARPRKRILAFAAAGCLAGLATCSSVRLFALLPEGLFDLIGCIFGLFLCLSFWMFDGLRSAWRALGFVGAGILFLALCFFFSVRQGTPTFVLKFGIFVVCGNLLGVIGYALGPSFRAILALAPVLASRRAVPGPSIAAIQRDRFFLLVVCRLANWSRRSHSTPSSFRNDLEVRE